MTTTTIELCSLNENKVQKKERMGTDRFIPSNQMTWFRQKLQDFAWWILKRIDASFDFPYRRIDYTAVHIDSVTLLEQARLNKQDVEYLWNHDGKYLVIGAATANALWGEMAGISFQQFEVTTRMLNQGSVKVLGLKVVIVPWIREGMFVMPELK